MEDALPVIELAGCAAVDVGPRCRLADSRELTLWHSGTQPLIVRTARGPLHPSRAREVSGGMQYTLTLPPGSQWLRVSASHHAEAALRVLQILEPERVPELEDAKNLQAAGELRRAQRVLQRYIEHHTHRDDVRRVAYARSLLASWAWNEGDNERAVHELRDSIAELRALGSVSDAVMRGAMLAYVLSYVFQRHLEARNVLTELSTLSELDPTSAAFLRLRRGQIALATGNFRDALAAIRSASEQFERLAHAKFAQYGREQEAITLATFGHHERAIEAQLRLLDTYKENETCRLADHREGVVWFALLSEPAPGSRLEQLAQRYSELAAQALANCSNPQFKRNHLIDAALLALLRTDIERAGTLLNELERLQGGRIPLYDTWEHELAGRYWLARDDRARSRMHFEQARALARQHAFWESEYLAWLGLGRSQLPDRQASLASFQHAERLLDEVLEWVPPSEGQTVFKRARESGSRQLMELLLSMGRVEEALMTARRARARILRSGARATRMEQLSDVQRQRWEVAIAKYRQLRDAYESLTADMWRLSASEYARAQVRRQELKARADGELDAARAELGDAVSHSTFSFETEALAEDELLLAYFPGPQSLFAFVKSASRTDVYELPGSIATPLVRSGSSLLSPLHLELSRATRLRLLLPSELSSVAFESLTLSGEPLVARFELVYVLDTSAGLPRSDNPGPHLVVADPTQDLPASAAEGRAVAQAMGAGAELLQGRSATRGAVMSKLPKARSFHFAGHAYYSGHDGLDSGLRLADGAVTVGEILALGKGPERVTLSACDSARSQQDGIVVGFGLAHAFVATGTRFVLATNKPVHDEVARVFFEDYYRALQSLDADDAPIVALRMATLQQRDRGEHDWDAFRVLSP